MRCVDFRVARARKCGNLNTYTYALTCRSFGLVVLAAGRLIPRPAELLKRFDLVNNLYGGLLDKKTKQPLFRAEALEAIKRLRVHIMNDCCSDAPNEALYFEAGKDAETLCPLFRCIRGTNDLEGFHLHMRLLVAWCIFPTLAHLLLLEYNYRWNLRQSMKNRGLDEAVGGFYDQPILEAIQVHLPQTGSQLCEVVAEADQR